MKYKWLEINTHVHCTCHVMHAWYGWDGNIHTSPFFKRAFNSKSQISGSIPRGSSLALPKNCIYFPVIGLNHIQCRKTIKIIQNQPKKCKCCVYHPCLVKFCKARRLLHPRKKNSVYCPTLFNRGLPRSTCPPSETSRHSPPNVPGAVPPSSEACQDTLGLPRSPPHISACATKGSEAKLLKLGHPT